MSTTLDKIQKRSKAIRWVILLFAGCVLAFIGYEFLTQGRLSYHNEPLFDALWQSGKVSKISLFLTTLPILLLAIGGVYFICKLLVHFERGNFFTQDCFSCFIYFIGTKIASILYSGCLGIATAYWHTSYFETTELVVGIEFGELVTLGILATVAYLLRAAQEISDENKEFI